MTRNLTAAQRKRAYRVALYESRKLAVECVDCGVELDEESACLRCEVCADKAAKSRRRYRQAGGQAKDRDGAKLRRQARLAQGQCRCGRPVVAGKSMCMTHLEYHRKKGREWLRAKRAANKAREQVAATPIAQRTCRQCSAIAAAGETRCPRHLAEHRAELNAATSRIAAAVPPRTSMARAPMRPKRAGLDPFRRLLAEAQRQVAGAIGIPESLVLARKVGDLFEQKLRDAGLLQDPATWTREDDIREESFSLSFDSAYRRVS